ncbi:MAG: cytochrome C biogenesis protein [Candidatus Eisenbacteria bacterium]|nr:cytochrome C biogenesis protein [Candidatus Eisenbacteria bacterium]
MQEIFQGLTEAVGGSLGLAAGAAFVWGILSVVLSPCHLSSIPLIVGYIGDTGTATGRRAALIAAAFAAGILATIAAVGIVTAALGRVLGDLGQWVNYGVALIFFVLGLHFLDVIPLNWARIGPRQARGRGLWAALVLGLVFGVAVGPCTFAYMAPMLGVALKIAAASWAAAVLLLIMFGIGHCSVIIAAGASVGLVQRTLQWNEKSRGAVLLRRACGVLVLLGGVYLIITAP